MIMVPIFAAFKMIPQNAKVFLLSFKVLEFNQKGFNPSIYKIKF